MILWFAKTSVIDLLARKEHDCNVCLEHSPLNRKLCWAPGSDYCLTHDNQIPLWGWDLELDAFVWYVGDVTFSVVFVFLSLVFFHCTGDNIKGPSLLPDPLWWARVLFPRWQTPAGCTIKFQKHKVISTFKSCFLPWIGDWTLWPPASLLTWIISCSLHKFSSVPSQACHQYTLFSHPYLWLIKQVCCLLVLLCQQTCALGALYTSNVKRFVVTLLPAHVACYCGR